MKQIKTVDAVGHVLCHDLTRIVKDQYKDAQFRKGHVVREEDIPMLLSMGKEHLYVWEMQPGMLHENDAAERLCAISKGPGMDRGQVKEGKIELMLNTKVVSYLGDELLSGVELETKGERHQLALQGLFVAIGHSPATDIFKGQIELDEQGYIVTDPSTTPASATSVKGVFAAGDCASREYHQAIVAAGAGCKAALDAEQYLMGIA